MRLSYKLMFDVARSVFWMIYFILTFYLIFNRRSIRQSIKKSLTPGAKILLKKYNLRRSELRFFTGSSGVKVIDYELTSHAVRLKLCRTLRTKRVGELLLPEKYMIYTCGITTDKSPHIGHMRVFFENYQFVKQVQLLVESRAGGTEVINIINFTDIDDKILDLVVDKQSLVTHVEVIKTAFLKLYYNLLRTCPAQKNKTIFLSCSDFLEEIACEIHKLAAVGKTTEIETSEGYGIHYRALTRQKSFCLWKNKQKLESISWDSGGLTGRPGWHIECSTMISRMLEKYQVKSLNMHMGGIDLSLIHHPNQVILLKQTCNHGVNRFMWSGTVTVDSHTKMSKSLNNTKSPDQVVSDLCLLRYFYASVDVSQVLYFNSSILIHLDKNLRKILDFIVYYHCSLNGLELNSRRMSIPDQTLNLFLQIKRNHDFHVNDLSSRLNLIIDDSCSTNVKQNQLICKPQERGLGFKKSYTSILNLINLVTGNKFRHYKEYSIISTNARELKNIIYQKILQTNMLSQVIDSSKLKLNKILCWYLKKYDTARKKGFFQVSDQIRQHMFNYGVYPDETAGIVHYSYYSLII